MMKKQLVFLCLTLISVLSLAQSDPLKNICYTLKVEKIRRPADTLNHMPDSSRNEFHLLKNGLYHFVINGKKYLYHRITDMTSDSITIALPGDDDPKITFSPHEINSMTTWHVDTALGWQSKFVESKDYSFSLVRHNDLYLSSIMKICLNEKCEKQYKGYLFFNDRTGFYTIFKKKKSYYIYGFGDAKTVKLNIRE